MAPWSSREECRKDHAYCTQLADFYGDNEVLRARIATLEAQLEQVRGERDKAKAYADKLVDAMPGLPKDLEVLRTGNTNLAKENAALQAENLALRERLGICKQRVSLLGWQANHPDSCECYACDITRLVDATDTKAPLTAAAAERALEKVAEAAKAVDVDLEHHKLLADHQATIQLRAALAALDRGQE